MSKDPWRKPRGTWLQCWCGRTKQHWYSSALTWQFFWGKKTQQPTNHKQTKQTNKSKTNQTNKTTTTAKEKKKKDKTSPQTKPLPLPQLKISLVHYFPGTLESFLFPQKYSFALGVFDEWSYACVLLQLLSRSCSVLCKQSEIQPLPSGVCLISQGEVWRFGLANK